MVKSDVGRELFTMGRCGATPPHELSSPCSSESVVIGWPAASASNPPTVIMVRGMGETRGALETAAQPAQGRGRYSSIPVNKPAWFRGDAPYSVG